MDKDNKLCNKCGLLPQDGTKPIPPCTCKKKKRCKKDCCDDGFAFRKVVIPAALGDDKTGKDKPANGAYTNSYVVYEANGAEYMYDSYGVYTPMESGGGSGGVSDFNELDNRPKYAGETMTGDTDIPDVSSDITNLQTQINSKQDALSAAQLSAVNSGIDSTKVGQIATNTSEITTIEQKIPSQASSSNQLADKNFVNSSIATNTAYYISDNGAPFASLADLEAYTGTVSNNDYAFVVGTDASGNTTYTRYKYNADSSEWAEEYVLNNSSFTAEQWATINSGITSGDVSKLAGLANIKSIGANLSIDSNGELSATDTTYSDFTGTDGTSAGTAGLVPAPATTDADKFLKSDGTWDTAGGGGIPTDATFWGQSYDATTNRVFGNIDWTGASIATGTSLIWGTYDYLNLKPQYVGSIAHSREIEIQNNKSQFSYYTLRLGTTVDVGTRRLTSVSDPTASQDAATKNYADNLVINYATINGTSAPTTATEGKYEGQLYLDTTNNQMYYLVSIDDTVDPVEYNWSTLGGGGIPTDATFWGQSYDATNNRVKGSIAITDSIENGLYLTFSKKTNEVCSGTISGSLSQYSPKIELGRTSTYSGDIKFTPRPTSTEVNRYLRISSGSVTISGIPLTMSNQKISNLANPTVAQDAATKNYVDSIYPVGAVFTSTSATAPTIAGGTWTEIGTQTIGSSTVHYYERTA